MTTLMLMRHAKSSWDQPYSSDFDRPLNKRGQDAAPRMARHLMEEHLVPDRILCSTATRARETVERMLTAWEPEVPELVLSDDLYHATPGTLVAVVREFGESSRCLLVVAHNPGMQTLASLWAGRPVRFPTATIARFVPGQIDELELSSKIPVESVWRPKELPEIEENLREEST